MSKKKLDELQTELSVYGEVWDGKLDPPPVFSRDTLLGDLERTVEATRSSLVLVGPSGCGKSLLLKHLATRLCRREPAWRVLETSASRLVAGKKYIGEWQGALKGLIEKVTRSSQVAVWFDDITSLAGAGRTENNDENMAAMLATGVERRQIILLGECTEQQYSAGLEPFPWFARLLRAVQIPPLTDEETAKIVEEAAQRRCEEEATAARRLEWSSDASHASCWLGRIYFPGAAPPSGALQLMDWTLRHAETEPQPSVAAPSADASPRVLSSSDVTAALCAETGLPRRLLDDSLPLPLAEVRQFFDERIMGQASAVRQVIDTIALVKAGLTNPLKPLSVMLFVGPTGVGKTELARALAEFVFGSPDRLLRLDMSEYQDFAAVDRFLGSSRDTKGASGLPARVRQQPFSVVLLDEIEKASARMFDLLLQLFDAGRLTDLRGETVNFTQTIVILTSNLGSELRDAPGFGFMPGAADSPDETVRDALRSSFRPELLNRIDRIVNFQQLSREHVRQIADRELQLVLARSGIQRRRLRIDVDRAVIDTLARVGYDPQFGARPLKRAVEQLVLVPLARLLSELDLRSSPELIQLTAQGDQIKLNTTRRESKPRSATRVAVPHPHGRGHRSLTRAQLLEFFTTAESHVGAALQDAEERGLTDRRTELVRRTSEPGFWNAPHAARDATHLYQLDQLLESCQRLASDLDGLRTLQLSLGDPLDRSRAERLVVDSEQLARRAELVRYMVRCDDQLQLSDVFLIVQGVDQEGAEQVRQLAEAYLAWSQRIGFRARVVHDEPLVGDHSRPEVILQIEGVAAYGVLQGEQGLNRFDSRNRRREDFVKVLVLPLDEGALGRDEVTIRCQHSRPAGRGLLGEKPRSKVRATAVDRGVAVSIQSDQRREEAERSARELLLAELARQAANAANTSSANPVAEPESIIRTWRLDANPRVKDLRTGVVLTRLRELWAGELTPLLLGWLDHRESASARRA